MKTVDEQRAEVGLYRLNDDTPPLKPGYYWFKSARSKKRPIAEYVAGEWFLTGEAGPVHINEINRRGWVLDCRVQGQDKYNWSEDNDDGD